MKAVREGAMQTIGGRAVQAQGTVSAKALRSDRILVGSPCCWLEKWIVRQEDDSGCPGRNLPFPAPSAVPGT